MVILKPTVKKCDGPIPGRDWQVYMPHRTYDRHWAGCFYTFAEAIAYADQKARKSVERLMSNV